MIKLNRTVNVTYEELVKQIMFQKDDKKVLK